MVSDSNSALPLATLQKRIVRANHFHGTRRTKLPCFGLLEPNSLNIWSSQLLWLKLFGLCQNFWRVWN